MGGISSNTVLMLHFDGADGASIITEGQYGPAFGFTAVNAKTVTSIVKFGATALQFNNVSRQTVKASVLTGWSLGRNPWTQDFWFYLNASLGDNSYAFIYNYTDSVVMRTGQYLTFQGLASLGGAVCKYQFTDNSTWPTCVTSGFVLPYGSWHHMAVARTASDVMRFWLDGVSVGSATVASTVSAGLDPVNSLFFGAHGPFLLHWFDGSLDEFRVTKGVALWLDDFTPPTEAYSWDIPRAELAPAGVAEYSNAIGEGTLTEVPDPATLTLSSPVVSDYRHKRDYVTEVATLTASPSAVRAGMLQFQSALPAAILELTAPSCNAGQPVVGDFAATGTLPAIEGGMVGHRVFGTRTMVGDNIYEEELFLTLPAITGSMGGTIPRGMSLSGTLPSISGSMTAFRGVNASISAELPRITGGFTATRTLGATITKTLPRITGQITGKIGIVGSITATLPSIEGTIGMSYGITGRITASLPAITGSMRIDNLVFQAVAVTLLNRSLTKFTNYPFNSFAYFNGVYLGCSSTGIHQLGGTADAGTEIAAHAETGFIDLNESSKILRSAPALNRLRHVILGYSSSGALSLSVVAANAVSYSYTVDQRDVSAYEGTRVKIGKGLKDRYVALKLSNVSGSAFNLDTMRVFVEPIPTKAR